MKKFIAALIVMALMLTSTAFAYTDISDEVLSDKVETLSKYNIINGYGDGSFKPGNPITRAEFCKMIMCATMNDGIEFADSKFSDVSDGFWAKDYICAAKSLGVVNGVTETTFSPQSNITNEQAVKMIVCALGYGEEAVAAGGYPYGYIKIAKDLGIINDGVDAKAISKRRDIAEMVYNILDVEFYFLTLTEDGTVEKSKSESTLREFYEFLTDEPSDEEENSVG